MALTINEIYTLIIAEKNTQPTISTLLSLGQHLRPNLSIQF